MQISSPTGKGSNQDPLDYVSKGWFPVNTAVLREVQSKLKSGHYEKDRNELINDLKSDFSLFAHCLRTMGASVPKKDRDKNPLELLRSLDSEILREIILDPTPISHHSFDPHMKGQVARIKHLLISCSAAEAFGEKKEISVDHSFLCALARQLGMTLVAFNYPRIYSQALASLKPDNDDFEKTLRRVLGYSPMQLGIKAVLGWSKHLPLQIGTGDATLPAAEDDPLMAYTYKDKDHKDGEELKKICEISEALARLNDAEHYPSATKKWEAVMSEVKNYLGSEGLEIITSKVQKYQTDYVVLSPELFKTEIAIEKHVRAASSQNSARLFAENSFIKGCHGNLRDEFERAYKLVKPDEVSPDAISALISKVIPLAGFTKGCIYLADHKTLLLTPKLKIGKVDISHYKALNLNNAGQNAHPAIDALNALTPIRHLNVVLNGEIVSHITGSFGNSEKSGVLYLEMGRDLVVAEREVSMLYFKALRQCLNDCLNLRPRGS